MKLALLFIACTSAIICVNAYEVANFQSRAVLPACNKAALDYVINCILERIRTKIENMQCIMSQDDRKYIFQAITKELPNILGIPITSCQALKTLLDGLFTTVNGVVCTLLAILNLLG